MNQCRIMQTIKMGLVVSLFIGGTAVGAQTRSTDDSEVAEFLHFGNMGGLMPELQKDDLPESGSQEADLLYSYCGQCHNVPGPGMRTQKQWSSIFWDMYWRMHLMNAQFKKFKVFKYNDGNLLYQYLQRHALKSTKSDRVDARLEGAREYQRTCMQCHELPDPKSYPQKDWGDLVKRMKRHMKSMGKLKPSPEETTLIIQYLEKAATH